MSYRHSVTGLYASVCLLEMTAHKECNFKIHIPVIHFFIPKSSGLFLLFLHAPVAENRVE